MACTGEHLSHLFFFCPSLVMFQIPTQAQTHYLRSQFFLPWPHILLHVAWGHAQHGSLLILSCHLALSARWDPASHITWVSRGPIRLHTKSNNTRYCLHHTPIMSSLCAPGTRSQREQHTTSQINRCDGLYEKCMDRKQRDSWYFKQLRKLFPVATLLSASV